MHEAAELDEWVPQCARIEDEQRELKRRSTSVDVMGLNNRTCRWPLFEGHEPFYEKLYCGTRPISGSPYCHAHSGQAFNRRTSGQAKAAE
jgi:hypothetical protein